LEREGVGAPTGSPVTWFEITSRNSVALRDLYADLFGWKLQAFPGETPYIEVDNPQTYLDRIDQAGGRTIAPVTVIPESLTFAHFADSEGNIIGLWKAADR